MDGEQFDTLVQSLGRGRARRSVLGLLLGVLVSPLLPAVPMLARRRKGKRTGHGRREKSTGHERRKRGGSRDRDRTKHSRADAQANKNKKKGNKRKVCPPCKKRTQGKCKGTNPDGTVCPGGSCRGGKCIATPATTTCIPSCGDKVCGDNGCEGVCGTCQGDLNCQNGQCVVVCDSGLTPCAGNCVDLQTDSSNCGTCRNQCIAPPNATATCASSTCGFACTEGFHDCGGSCVSDGNPAHCGTACTPCPHSICSPATCDGTTCGRAPIPECCTGDGDCGDNNACTADTCGADNTCRHTDVCPPTEVCIADGMQAHCCPQSRPLWDGSQCAECTQSDVTRCATPPNAAATCDGQGACSFTCDAGWGDCGSSAGCETNLKTDNANCGTCGHVCTGGEMCRGGSCTTCVPATEDLHAVIAAASPGDTVRLCAGTWALTSPLQIGKNLTLRGAGEEQTILDGGNAVRVLSIAAGTTVTLQDLQITRGYATGIDFMDMLGGGIFNDGTLTLKGSRVTGNRAAANGGGIYNTIDALMLSLEGSSVTGNTAGNEAGGIYNFLGTAALQDSSVTDNSAFNGGGITSGGTLTLKGSTVTGNTADHMGGGIWSRRTVTLEGSSVMGNHAGAGTNPGYGGGIHHEAGTLTLKGGSSVTNNTADLGGGIIISDGDSTMTLADGSSVSGNTATRFGGGIYNNGTLTLNAASSVTDNSATENGGGISNLGTLILEANSSVTGNTAGSGGGISNHRTVTLQFGSSVSGNTALNDGGGIHVIRGKVSVADTTIVVNNTPNNCAGTVSETCIGCAPAYTACDGECIDTLVHRDHCGGCGQVCDDDFSCVNGQCIVLE